MKKFYLLLLTLMISVQSFAQIQCYVGDPINIIFGDIPQIPLVEQEYIFTPTTNGELTVCGTNCMSAIIQSTCFQPLDPISAQGCFCSGAPSSSLTFSLQAFVSYSIYLQPLGCTIDPGCPSVTFTIPSDDPCFADAQLIGCGFSDDGSVGLNNFNATIYNFASSSDCLDNGAGDQLPFDFNGPDHIYELMLPEDPMQNESYFISLEELGSDLDLFLYVCENEALYYCFQSSIGPEGVPNDELIIFDFNYSEWQSPQVFIIVDSKDQFGGGGYHLSVTCVPEDCSQDALPIMCGETLSNQDTGAPTEDNTVELSNYTSCYDGANPYDGNDIVYELVIEEEQQFKVVVEMLNGTDADVFLMDSCALGEPTCVISSTEDNSGGITTEIIDMHLTVGTYYIVVEEHTPGTAAQFDISISCECSCIETYSNPPPSGQLYLCENFENMEEGAVAPQSTRWRLWENDEPVTSPSAVVQMESGNHSLSVEQDADVAPNVIYDLENQTEGRYRISWNMWIEEGFSGYFSMLHESPDEAGDNAVKAYEVFFLDSGLGNLYPGSEASAGTPLNVFSFYFNNWNSIVNIIDIDQNQAELWLNNELIGSWNFSITDQGTSSSQLAGINFFATTGSNYKIDNICVWKAGDCVSDEDGPAVCLPTGQEFSSASEASCNLYTSSEWELCFTICDKGGRFISRGELIRGTIEGSDYVPLQCLTDSCVLDSYMGSLPNFPLYTDSYIFYDDELSDSLYFTTPGSLDLVLENNNDNIFAPKFFLYTCDCENAEDPETCQQTCQGELEIGSFFDFDFSGTGFYYILAIAPENTNYSFALQSAPGSAGDPCNQDLFPGFPDLECGTSFVNSVEFGSQDLDYANAGDYGPCLQSDRTYLGKERKYVLNVGETILFNCTLNSDADMGIFLYDFLCGTNCINAAENPDGGGEAKIESFELIPGTYYLVVDKATLSPAQTDTFSLTVSCDTTISLASYQFDNNGDPPGSNCNTVVNEIHEVHINETAFPFLPDSDKTRVFFYRRVENNPDQFVYELPWANTTGFFMPFLLEKDDSNDPQCAYTNEDTLRVFVGHELSGGYCDVSYGVPSPPDSDPGIYEPGKLSTITNLELTDLGNYYLSPPAIEVQAAGVTDKQLIVHSDGAPWEVVEDPDAPWLSLSRTNDTDASTTLVTIDPFEDQMLRETYLRFKFVTIAGDTIYRTVPITQRGKCFPAEIEFTIDSENICTGSPLTIFAGPQDDDLSVDAYEFEWSTSSTEPFTVIPNPQNGLPISVTMRDRFCPESDSDTYVITGVQPLPPNPVGIGNPSACLGDDTMITLEVQEQEAGTMFLWYETPVGGTLLHEGAQYEVSSNMFDAPGQYSFFVETLSPASCSSEGRTEIMLTIHELPEVEINMDMDVTACINSTVMLQALASNGQPNYNFVWDDGTTGPIRLLNPPLENQIYTVTVSDGRGCQADDEISVTTLPAPEILQEVEDASCEESNGSIEVQPVDGAQSYSYEWDTGDSGPIVSNLASGTYTVTVTDGNTCTAEFQIPVANIPGPDLTLSLSPGDVICIGDTVQITAIASGPNMDFIYKWSDNLGTEDTIIQTPPENTTYSVTVTDGNGCTIIDEVTITVNELPEVSFDGNLEICPDGSTDVTAIALGEDPFTCSWEGLGADCTQTLSPPENTTFFVTVTNDNTSCSTIADVNIVVNANPTVTTEVTPTNCEESTGTATASPAGGEGTYTYLWDNGETTPTISNLPVGVYNVVITDGNTCTASADAIITEAEAPTIEVVDEGTQDATCGEENGTITVEADGGTLPYTYAWDNEGSGATISNLAPGTYTVTVTDGNMCSAVIQATIAAIPVPSVVVSPDTSICAGEVIVINAVGSGGVGDLDFQWSDDLGTDQTASVSPVNDATYSVVVTDVNGCMATDDINITVNALPVIDIDGNLEICLGGSTDLTASAAGEDSFTCSWEDLGTDCTQTLSPPENTTYFVTVTNDNTSCRSTTDVYVIVNENPTVTTEVSETNCEGSTGTATAFPMGGEGAYTYLWDNGEITPTISNLPVGTYNVVITDTNMCTASADAIITEAEAPTVSVIEEGVQDATCGEENGIISVAASGGTGSYTYAWDNGDSGPIINNLAPGTYTVTVTDTNMCSAVTQETIVALPVPSVVTSPDTSICEGDELQISAFGSGGVGDLDYQWSNDLGTDQTASVSPVNDATYSVVVTDANGCMATDDINITVNALPVIDIDGNLEICLGGSTDLTASAAGEDSFTCSWEDLGTDCTQTLSPPENTTYFVTVTNDNTSCRSTTDVYVIVNENPTVTTEVTETNCEESTGTATALPMGGEGAYTYLWDNGETTPTISNLPVGIYNVVITDTNMCTASADAVIIEAEAPTVSIIEEGVQDATCGEENGTISVAASGGTGSYTYAWDNGDSGPIINNLAPGTYTVTVTDTNMCSAVTQETIVALPVPSVVTSPDTSICEGDELQISAFGSGGVGDLDYQWSNDLGTDQTASVSPVNDATYSVVVTDANGCMATDEVNIIVNGLPQIEISGDTEICLGESTDLTVSSPGEDPFTCSWEGLSANCTQTLSPSENTTYFVTVTNNSTTCRTTTDIYVVVNDNPTVSTEVTATNCEESTGTATALPMGGEGAYTYLWDNGETTPTISNLPVGIYNVVVTDSNMCTASADAIIIESEAPTVEVLDEALQDATCRQANGSITVEASGGAPPYNYAWNNGDSGATINDLEPGIYTVTVTDINMCSAITQATIEDTPVPSVSIDSDSTLCIGDELQLLAVGIGGVGDLEYMWNDNFGTDQEITVNPTEDSTYVITVTDENDCIATDEITVLVYDLPVVAVDGDLEICSGESTPITLNGFGMEEFSCDWGMLGTDCTQNLDPLEDATYAVNVTDINTSCQTQVDVNIVVNDNPTVSTTSTASECDQPTGTATAMPIGGSPGYTYHWSNDSTTQTIIDVFAGTYAVTVTDTNSCIAETTVTVDSPEAPVASMPDPQEPGCAGGAYNLNLMVSEGTPPYSYNWNEGLESEMNPVVILDESTTYIVTVTDDNGCSTVAQSFVMVFEPIDIVFQEVPEVLCVGGEVLLEAEINGNWSTLEWTSSAGGSLSNPNILNPTLTIADDAPAQITLSITSDGPVCPEVTDSVSIAIQPLPTASSVDTLCTADLQSYSVIVATDADSISSNFGVVQLLPDNTFEISAIDSGQNIVLTLLNTLAGCERSLEVVAPVCNCLLDAPGFVEDVSSCDYDAPPVLMVSITSGLQVNWYNSDGAIVAENTDGTYEPSIPGTYFAQAYDPLSTCLSADQTAVTWDVVPSPEVNITGMEVLCEGDTLELNAAITGTYDSVLWSTGEVDVTAIMVFPPQSPSIYTAMAFNGTCVNTDTFEVSLFEMADWGISVLGEIACYGDETVDMVLEDENGNTPNSIIWNTGSTSFFLSNQGAGTYEATFTDANGCSFVLDTTITEPPAITIEIEPDTSVVVIGDTVVVLSDTLCVNVNGGTPDYTINLRQGTANGPIVSTMSDVAPGLVKFTGLADECYFIEVIDANDCMELQESVKIIITDVEEKLSKERYWTVYPNPTTGQVFVQINSNNHQSYEIAVTDVLGQLIYQKGHHIQSLVELDLSTLAAGVYLIHLNIDGNIYTKKLAIQ